MRVISKVGKNINHLPMFWNQFFWCFSYFDVSMHIIVTLEVFVQINRELKQPQRLTATRTLQICIFYNEKRWFWLLCTCIFQIWTFRRRSNSFYDVKWPVLQVCGRREHMAMFNFVFLPLMRWFQFIPGMNTFFKRNDLGELRNDCRKAKWHIQTKFSLSSTSCLLLNSLILLCNLGPEITFSAGQFLFRLR